jgi:hypothetical protein
MHMGFVPNALVKALRRAPAGDPTVYAVDGIEIALRHETASAIRVKLAQEALVSARETETRETERERGRESEKNSAPVFLAEVAQ